MMEKIRAMVDELNNEIHSMRNEVKDGQIEILNKLHTIERESTGRHQNTEIRIDRLETYASQGKWALAVFTIPVVGSLVKLFFDFFHPAK